MQVDEVNVKAVLDSDHKTLRLHEKGVAIRTFLATHREHLYSHLECIEFPWKRIGNTLVAEISKFSALCRSLTKIDLRDNYVGDTGCKSFSTCFANHKTLQVLNLSGNRITDLGAATLSSLLLTECPLKELDLSGNDIKAMGVQAMGGGLRVNSTLLSLNLVENFFGDDGAVELGWTLTYNSTLQVLNIKGNDISNAGVGMIATGLQKNEGLRHLILADNAIQDRGACGLSDALFANTVLHSLDLRDNDINTEGREALLDATELSFRCEHLSEDIKLAVAMGLHHRLGEQPECFLQEVAILPENNYKQVLAPSQFSVSGAHAQLQPALINGDQAIVSGKALSAADKAAMVRAERAKKDEGRLPISYFEENPLSEESPVRRILETAIHKRRRQVYFDG